MNDLDLTTLAAVKSWLYKNKAESATTADADLTRMITSASQLALSYLNRPTFALHTVTELINGNGQVRVQLREWPVLGITSVSMLGVEQTASVSFGSGWVLDPVFDGYAPGSPQFLTLRGRYFPRGPQTTQIVYPAGYSAVDEAFTADAAGAVQTTRGFIRNRGAKTAAGVALTKVTTAPTAGQYKVGDDGKYEFNTTQLGGAGVLLGYDWVPYDVQQAVAEWIGERWQYSERVGMSSKSQGQQTTAYTIESIPRFVKTALQRYRRVI